MSQVRRHTFFYYPELSLGATLRLGLAQLCRRDLQKWGRWSLVSLGVTLMAGWDGKLVLATGAGLGSLAGVYWLLNNPCPNPWQSCRRFLNQSQGHLTLAAGTGGLASMGTYLAATAWAESEQKWLATGIVLNGLGTLLTLALVAWNGDRQNSEPDGDRLGRLFWQLAQSQGPLEKLVTLRQLKKYQLHYSLSEPEQEELREYLVLLLNQENDPRLREAILELLPPAPTPLVPLKILQREPG